MKRSSEQELGIAHSMTDLMAGVAVAFLVLASIFMVRATAAKNALETDLRRQMLDTEERTKLAAVRTQEDKKAAAALKRLFDTISAFGKTNANAVDVKWSPRDPFLLVVMFVSENWFAPNECKPNRIGTQTNLRQGKGPEGILSQVFEQVCQEEEVIDSIVLEGHTDPYPFCGAHERCGAITHCSDDPEAKRQAGFRNNIRLSAARAQEVFFLALDHAAASNNIPLRKCLVNKFVVSGRGPVEPKDVESVSWDKIDIHEQSNEAQKRDRQDDRRVVLKIRYRTGAQIVATDHGKLVGSP